MNFYLLIACDLRLESPLLNIRIKKNYNLNKNNELYIYSYGLSLKFSTFPIKNISNCILKFLFFLEGRQRFLCDFFLKSFFSFNYLSQKFNFFYKTIFFFGNSIINRVDAKSFLISYFFFLKKKFNIISFNLINNYLGYYSYNNICYNNEIFKLDSVNLLYLLNSETNEIKSNFIIYQGFLKNDLYYKSDLILSSSAPYEYDALYINLEGRYRFLKQAVKSFMHIYND